MRFEPPRSSRASYGLSPERPPEGAGLSREEAIRLVGEACADEWVAGGLSERAVRDAIRDEGLFWVDAEEENGDIPIWPVRVLVMSWAGMTRAIWLTYDQEVRDFIVVLQDDAVIIPEQRGDAGRVRLLSKRDEPESTSAA